MDIDLVFKIAAVGIVVSVLNQLLIRSDRPDQAMLVSIAGLVSTMMLLVEEISTLFDLVKMLFGF
ncbi:MAG: stage III sporulation protein AC [Oscillospiraceae bacterium]|nr:stage III sporulation protein AC [Oscillospiraceae bacterium]MBR7149654.1 stage III sporulation protein AC [Oscillospiraceae bacterium]